LVGYWKFDEGTGTTAADFSGRGNTGTLVNGPTWTNGKLQQALTFTATSQQSVITGAFQKGGDPNVLTFSAWIKDPDFGSASRRSIFSTTLNNASGCWSIEKVGNGSAGAISVIIPTIFVVRADGVINDAEWHHIVYVRNGSGATHVLYVDGVSVPLAVSSTNTFVDCNEEKSIGQRGGSSQYWQGGIDDVRLYNRALSAAEIANLYNTGAARISAAQTSVTDGLVSRWTFDGGDVTDKVYDRIGGNNGYFVGAATSSAKTIGKLGQGLSFNGSTSRVDLPPFSNPTSVTDYSISLWLYMNAHNPGTGHRSYVYDFRGNGSTASGPSPILYIDKNPADNKGIIYAQSGTALSSSAVEILSQWHNIVVTRSGSVTTIYLDGVSIKSGNAGSGSRIDVGGRIGTAAAAITAGDYYLDGKVDEFRLYDRALSATEVKQLYAAGK
jgi:hypothetical protein